MPPRPAKARPKKRPSSSASPTPLRRRGRRLVETVLLVIGCVLLLDALVGEKGLVEMMKARQESEALPRAMAYSSSWCFYGIRP
jgi:hypothetical protein